jgi:heme/copper-type cytochrome/quinol oxidase subunit 3
VAGTVASASASATASPAARHRERTALLGMTLFIASWAMLFAALFFAYGLSRVRSLAWPPADLPRLPLGLPALATVALALSSACLQRAQAAARRGAGLVRPGILASALLGAGFLALQLVVWRALWAAGLRPETGTYASVFYGLTVFHALHVAVGLCALAVLAAPGARAATALRLWTIYWHTVGVLWGLMFLLVYVV